MRLVINRCFGGYSLSPKAVKRMAELQGRECYFFRDGIGDHKYTPIKNPSEFGLFFTAFDVPDPNVPDFDYSKHHITSHPDDRSDPLLLQVVEELGPKANGSCAQLAIVEIPDGIEYTIEEYDGSEHVAEKHRTWS